MNKNILKKAGKLVVGVGALVGAIFSVFEAKDAFKDFKDVDTTEDENPPLDDATLAELEAVMPPRTTEENDEEEES